MDGINMRTGMTRDPDDQIEAAPDSKSKQKFEPQKVSVCSILGNVVNIKWRNSSLIKCSGSRKVAQEIFDKITTTTDEKAMRVLLECINWIGKDSRKQLALLMRDYAPVDNEGNQILSSNGYFFNKELKVASGMLVDSETIREEIALIKKAVAGRVLSKAAEQFVALLENGNSSEREFNKAIREFLNNDGVKKYGIKTLGVENYAINSQLSNGQTLLHMACEKGNVEAISALIKAGAEVDARNRYKDRPLHMAYKSGNIKAMHVLLHNMADPNRKNSYKQTPLHLACKDNNVPAIMVLMSANRIPEVREKADPDSRDMYGGTPLSYVEALVDKGVKLEQIMAIKKILRGNKTERRVHVQVAMGDKVNIAKDFEEIQTQIKHIVDLLNKSNPSESAIIAAIQDLDQDCVDTKYAGQTLLHIACARGMAKVVVALVQAGANPAILDKDWYTPLHFACGNGNKDIVEFLLEQKNVKIDEISRMHNTPLHSACMHNHAAIAKVLLDNNADPNILNKRRKTALHFACEKGNLSIVNGLLVKRANPTLVDIDGNTSFHLACKYGHYEVVEELLKQEIELNGKNELEETPLGLLLHNSDKAIETIKKDESEQEINKIVKVIKLLLQNKPELSALLDAEANPKLLELLDRGYLEESSISDSENKVFLENEEQNMRNPKTVAMGGSRKQGQQHVSWSSSISPIPPTVLRQGSKRERTEAAELKLSEDPKSPKIAKLMDVSSKEKVDAASSMPIVLRQRSKRERLKVAELEKLPEDPKSSKIAKLMDVAAKESLDQVKEKYRTTFQLVLEGQFSVDAAKQYLVNNCIKNRNVTSQDLETIKEWLPNSVARRYAKHKNYELAFDLLNEINGAINGELAERSF